MNAGNVFRAYDIRGVVDKDFNAEWVTHLGKACGTYLAGRGISSAVIGYDCRHSSPAYHDALVEGILSTGTDVISIGMVPTPALYFAVKHLNRQGGVMITASHNPPEYNGFKVWAGQSTIHGEEIQKIKAIFEEGAFAEGTGTASRIDIIPTYKQDILSRFKLARPVKVVLDGGNGAGGEICADILTKLGATVIPMFCEPDGDFPTCPYPNPESPDALKIGLEWCEKTGADLLIATDPDSDRLGVVAKKGDKYERLNGNEVGILLLEYILRCRKAAGTLPEHPVTVRTIVSTSMVDRIAEAYGVEVIQTLTGFKWIGDQIAQLEAAGEVDRFIFGFEESYGYLAGPYVRDKDAVIGSMLICEMAAAAKSKGRTLIDELNGLYARFGYYLDAQDSHTLKGKDGAERIAAMMARLRGGARFEGVSQTLDYAQGLDGLPRENVMKFLCADGSWFAVRPSGTEPKIKIYYSIKDTDETSAEVKLDTRRAEVGGVLGL